MENSEKFMIIAIEEAQKAFKEGEIPIGAVAVLNDRVFKAKNCVIKKNDPTAHAEIELIKKISKKIGNYRLIGTRVFVTVEPCPMCMTALIHARISELYYGTKSDKWGYHTKHKLDLTKFNHKIVVHGGILEEICGKILKNFFKNLR